MRRDHSAPVCFAYRALSRMVLRRQIINRNRDCSLFRTGLGCRCIVVTMEILAAREARGIAEKLPSRTRAPAGGRHSVVELIIAVGIFHISLSSPIARAQCSSEKRTRTFASRAEATFFTTQRFLFSFFLRFSHSFLFFFYIRALTKRSRWRSVHSTHVTLDRITVKPFLILSFVSLKVSKTRNGALNPLHGAPLLKVIFLAAQSTEVCVRVQTRAHDGLRISRLNRTGSLSLSLSHIHLAL